jgi:hypothetical protein
MGCHRVLVAVQEKMLILKARRLLGPRALKKLAAF